MDWDSARRSFQTALIWVAAGALAFVLWRIRAALLLAFGAIMLAILLRIFSSIIARWTRASEHISLALATCFVLAVIGVTAWLFGSQMSNQFNEVLQHVETGEQNLRRMLQASGFGGLGSQVTQTGVSFISNSAREILAGGLHFVEAVVIMGISAIYLAAQPQLYRRGIVYLFRPKWRPRAAEAVDVIGRSLKLWLLGQLVLMLATGILSFIAVWLIGLPNPVALGLIAGIAEIIPYLGPFISAIPAVLVALTQGLGPAVWTIIAYLLIHMLEGYVSAPLLQRYFVTIPPALILIGIAAVDLLFGAAGIVLGAPITVALYIAVKMSYVEDPLEEEDHEQRPA
ncbi:MAG TPA: AI-2E family transporter [Pseudolabrys sp.]|jgi:predicted PurR-regulated permease PerM|nr:AI-2E family transporter [Pseudolabrys sp.]